MARAGTWRRTAIIVATQRPAGGVRGHVKRWADGLPQQKVFKRFKPALNGAQHPAASAQPGRAAAVRTRVQSERGQTDRLTWGINTTSQGFHKYTSELLKRKLRSTRGRLS